jgi:N-methylhydantoinase A
MSGEWRIGVDIGGTFTDIVLLGPDGRLAVRKVSSTVDDYARAIVEGLEIALQETGLTAADVRDIRHGATVASNAILERRGAKVGLIGTDGFRDVLEIRTLRMPRLYDLAWEKPKPLVPRRLRLTVPERIDASGNIDTPLDMDVARRVVNTLVESGVDAIAVAFINAYANPAHEQAMQELILERSPDVACCISTDVLPEIREYERTSTTVVNSYVLPVVAAYLKSLQSRLIAQGISAPLSLMQSSGGLTPAAAAAKLPVHIIESGPAGGVVGAQALAAPLGERSIVSFDMGGTTAKAALVIDGRAERAEELQVGGESIQASRLLTGQGYSVKTRAIDLAEVGAGGGSVVWIDPGGAMQIGPRSAGATPGPVAYGMGGTEPTVTDANLILGYLNPIGLAGGERPLNLAAAQAVFQTKVADPLGLSLEEAAYGARRIAVANMMRAIRAVTVERGRDPRSASLFAFGGNGPLFGWDIATALGMARVIAPPAPGLFSAFGLIYAEVEHHYGRTLRRVLETADASEIEAAWKVMEAEAQDQLSDEGFVGVNKQVQRTASLRYKGQTHELEVDWSGPLHDDALAQLAEAFGTEHSRVYGHRAGAAEPVELITLRVAGRGIGDRPPLAKVSDRAGMALSGPRQAYFGKENGWLETEILTRSDLASGRAGPFIVEEYDATCLAPPGVSGKLDSATGAIILNRV